MNLNSPRVGILSKLTIQLLVATGLGFALFLSIVLAGLVSGSSALASGSVSREDIRKELNLVYNQPNPFNPSTTINYVLLQPAHVKIQVYDVKGRHMACLVDEFQNDGENYAVWKTQTAPSGTYIFSLEADGVRVFRKMMLVR